MTNKQGYAAYPPKVEQMQDLGYVGEATGIFHSRDIGRSFQLFGKVYYSFGDTFCSDSEGNLIDIESNTVAVVSDIGKPLESKYLQIGENGLIKPLLELTPEEQQVGKDGKGRVVLWPFGGVIEMADGTGRLWYQKGIVHGSDLEYVGTGIAKVKASMGYEQQPSGHRYDGLIWGPQEPRMGTFTAINHHRYIYLYGDRPDGKIILARIYVGPDYGYQISRLRNKKAYEFWGGAGWVPDWRNAAVVIEGMQQGAIVRSKLFGKDKPFVFVGTSKWADSQVFMGASAKLEGPWSLKPVCKLDGLGQLASAGRWMYCMYPHLWASDEENGDLFVTYSEPYPGGVAAVKIKLAAIARV